MEVLFVFLKWVASFAHMDAETGSKMDLGNLATVICPSILCARGKDAVRDETFSGVRVIQNLLENQDEFFTVPAEFLSLLHDQDYFVNSMDLPSKEFMKKCDTYMRLKGGNGRPTPGTPYMGHSNGTQQQQPRYAPLISPNTDRPPPGSPYAAPQNLDRTPRIPQNESYPPPGSPNLSQGMMHNPSMMQNMQRGPPIEDWNPVPPAPRPPQSNGSSRPSSFVGQSSRQPNDQIQQNQSQGQNQGQGGQSYSPANGYPSTGRPRQQ